MRYTGFVGPSARARSKIACDDRTVNLFIEKNESGTGKAPYTMYRTPGYTEWCDLSTTEPVRGNYSLNGQSWSLAGDTLYRLPLLLGGSPTTLATGINNPDDSPASIIGNGDGGHQLVFAAGSMLYCLDLITNTLTTIPDIQATFVEFMNGTFYALDPNTSTIFASDPEDGTTWDPLAVFQRSSAPDKILAIARVGTEIFAFGSQTTSVLFDAGATPFPLQQNTSIFIQRGIAAPWSLAVIDNSAIWLGAGIDGAGTVYQMQGYTPKPISTPAVEYAISQYAQTADAEGGIYQEDGNQFYVLRFPSANATWCYDLTEGFWHERGNWNGLDYDAVPVRGFVYANQHNLVGSSATGVIYRQSLDYATETDGETGIRWMRRAPHLCEEMVRNTYSWLQLDAEVGVGLSTTFDPDADPQVYLRWSNDGGQSFGNVHAAALGAVGQYQTRVIWRMLGQARDRVFEMFGAAKVVTALVDCYLGVRPGTS